MVLIYLVLAFVFAGIVAWVINTYIAVMIKTILTIAVIVIVVGKVVWKSDFVLFEDA